MRKLSAAAVLALSLFGGSVLAQVSVPNTFVAGSPARAADVNANFQALVTGINALGTRVSKLEGQIAAADLAGTYTIHQFQTELGGGGSQRVAVYTSNAATATLAADGTASISSVTTQGHQLNLPGGSLTARNDVEPAAATTWTLSGGRVNMLGGSFSVADGGRLLIRVSANPADGTNVLLLLVRAN